MLMRLGDANQPVLFRNIGGDFGYDVIYHHFDRDIDGGREAQRIGPAMAFDHDAIKPQEDAAIMFARIHALAERREGAR